MTPPDISRHVLDDLPSFLAGGLDAERRAQITSHLAACATCAAALDELGATDAAMQKLFAVAVPAADFEDRLITNLRENTMRSNYRFPLLRRAGIGVAAAIALGATGVLAQQVVSKDLLGSTESWSEKMVALADFGRMPWESREPNASNERQVSNEAKALTVSADRRYVLMNISPKLANLDGISKWDVNGKPASGGGEVASKQDTGGMDAANKSGAERATELFWRSVVSNQTTPKSYMQKSDPSIGGTATIVDSTRHYHMFEDAQTSTETQTIPASTGIPGSLGRSLTKSGSGTLTLNGTNTYTGGTTVSAGTLELVNNDAITTVGDHHEIGRTPVVIGGGTMALNGVSFGYEYAPTAPGTDRFRVAQNAGFGDGHVDFDKFGGKANANPEVHDALVEVADGQTGKVSFGAGVSSNSGLIASTDGTNGTGAVQHATNTPTGPSRPNITLLNGEQASHYESTVVPNRLKPTVTSGETSLGDEDKRGEGKTQEQRNTFAEDANWSLNLERRATQADAPAKGATSVSLARNYTADPIKPTVPVAAPPVAPAATRPAAPSAIQLAARKIIRNGTVEYEVKNFDDAFATVQQLVDEEGGIIAATNSERLPNGKMSGNITIRVAPENLDRLVLKLRGIGELKNQQIGSSDVTKQYTDMESELRALRAMEERLIAIIKTGKGEVKDLVAAEKQLGDYRVQIEKIEGEIRYYNNLVSMATLSIRAYEKDIRQPAAATETEAVTMAVETEDVEAKYADARKFIADAKGRIVESDLKRYDADQLNARIVCDVPQDQAEHLTVQLRQLGRVARLDRDKRVTNDGTSAAPAQKIEQKDTRLLLSLYNLANVAPREVTVITVAAADVEAFSRKVAAAVRREVQPEKDGKPAILAGRVINSTLNGQRPEQMTADIRADVRTDQADTVLELIRSAGAADAKALPTGEVLSSSVALNSDTVNSTNQKRGIQLRIVAFAAVPPRETVNITAAATNVAELYDRALKAAQKLESAGKAQILRNNFAEPSAGNASATLDLNILRAEREALDAILADAGVLTRSLDQAQDPTGRTDSKVAYRLNLVSADALPAARTTGLTVEVADVAAALSQMRELIARSGAREIDSSAASANGADSAKITIEMPTSKADELIGRARSLGQERDSKVVRNQGVPEGKLSRDKLELHIEGANSLQPVRITTLMVEVSDVAKAASQIREAVAKHGGREIDSTATHTAKGEDTAHLVVEVPLAEADGLVATAKALGMEKAVNVARTQGVAETRLSRERLDLTIVTRQAILGEEKSLGATTHAALRSAAKALMASLYLVLTAVLFALPWALLVWAGLRFFRRRSKTVAIKA